MISDLLSYSGWKETSVTKVFAPGRIEVLGKHTDYAGGDSVTCAVHLGIYFIAKSTGDDRICIESAQTGEQLILDLQGIPISDKSHWMIYPKVLVERLLTDFPNTAKGVHIILDADLPQAAGMSSSSAMVVGLFLALNRLWSLSETVNYQENIRSRLELGEYLGAVENGLNYASFPAKSGVGTFGGSEDHVAVLCSEPGSLGHFSYLPTIRRSAVRLPNGLVFVVASSGVWAEKSGNALELYNRASTRASELCDILYRHGFSEYNTLGEIQRSGDASPETVYSILRDECEIARSIDLSNRYTQFYSEIEEIIPRFLSALDSESLDDIGVQVDRSQLLAETMLGNQVPETIYLARKARTLGALAASAFGGGFGGSVWSLVKEEAADSFKAEWQEQYSKEFPSRKKNSMFFLARASSPAEIIE